MSIDWQNGASDRARSPLPESYRPRALRLAAADPGIPPAPLPDRQEDLGNPDFMTRPDIAPRIDAAESQVPEPPVVDLRKLEADIGRRRLDEIADVVRLLTYGEMMELAESMWSVRPSDSELTESNLPAVLYRWSTSRQS